ncbi:hypothetical protein ACLOJK_020941 [Asimina triloba]
MFCIGLPSLRRSKPLEPLMPYKSQVGGKRGSAALCPPMAALNPEAAEFTPISTSSPPPDQLLPTLFPPSTQPCCLPLLPGLESHPASHLPFMEFCPPPQFSIYNNNLNVYYASGFLWPGPDPLLKNPFPDPLWHYLSSLAAAPAAREPPPLSLLPQPDDQASVVEGQKSCVREGEAEEVVASSRRGTSTVHGGHRAGGRKTTRSASQSQWRKIERFQSPEQGKGMPQCWIPRRGRGESCSSHQQSEEQSKHTTLMIRNIPNKFT